MKTVLFWICIDVSKWTKFWRNVQNGPSVWSRYYFTSLGHIFIILILSWLISLHKTREAAVKDVQNRPDTIILRKESRKKLKNCRKCEKGSAPKENVFMVWLKLRSYQAVETKNQLTKYSAFFFSLFNRNPNASQDTDELVS